MFNVVGDEWFEGLWLYLFIIGEVVKFCIVYEVCCDNLIFMVFLFEIGCIEKEWMVEVSGWILKYWG